MKFEVILIDSGSTDETLKIAQEFPLITYRIPAGTFHHARTRNYAASLARGEFLVYLAADAFPAVDNWLEALTGNLADPSVGAVYGRHLPKPGATTERQHVLHSMYGKERIVKDSSRRRELGFRYYHFSTVNAAIRRKAWEATPFPEDLKVFEDVGIAKRILDSGWKIVYEPEACVFHSHNHTAKALFQRYFDSGVVSDRLQLYDRLARASLFHEGWRLARQKLVNGMASGNRVGSIRAMLYDLAKYAGWILGRNARLLPYGLRRRFSAFGLFE